MRRRGKVSSQNRRDRLTRRGGRRETHDFSRHDGPRHGLPSMSSSASLSGFGRGGRVLDVDGLETSFSLSSLSRDLDWNQETNQEGSQRAFDEGREVGVRRLTFPSLELVKELEVRLDENIESSSSGD